MLAKGLSFVSLVLFLVSPCLGQSDFVFRYYTTAPCGNDWFTRCLITPTENGGADFEIYHGFMRTPLVDSGKMSREEWSDFQRRIVEPARRISTPQGYAWGEHLSLTAMGGGVPVTESIRADFLATAPGKRFLYWRGQTKLPAQKGR